ncbi:MAG: dihydroorotase [Candidatus Taylorbacteria bacterium]|nr:dihydroorotase [Candidatus Taylorbacteria bacterium]
MKLTIRRPDNWHIHFRQGEMLKNVVPFTASVFGRALVMPNTKPPIDENNTEGYREEILNAAKSHSFSPLMTVKLTKQSTPESIRKAKERGAVAVKYYPEGVTTNSEDGVANIKEVYSVMEEMEREEMILSIHAEEPRSFVLSRESDFLPRVSQLIKDFPKLSIVIEHITTEQAVEFVLASPDRVAATITVHHLYLTLHDVLCFRHGDNEFLNPHHYCKPVAKTPFDCLKLREAALSGNPKFFYGGDSAPHPRKNKESDCGCAGVFSAPVEMPLLTQFFETKNALGKLEPFVSEFGARFYKVPVNEGTITLEKEFWTVAKEYHGVVPFFSGETLLWKVEGAVC